MIFDSTSTNLQFCAGSWFSIISYRLQSFKECEILRNQRFALD